VSKALIVTNFCFGSVRPHSIVCAEKPYIAIENIIKASKGFDFCFVVNDAHSKEDPEFNYLPSHMVNHGVDVARLHHFDRRLQSKYVQFLNKDTLSAIHNPHNKRIILGNQYDLIAVAGFSASTDIIATCLDLIDEKKKIAIIPSCIDDTIKDFRSKALNYLTFIGVPSLEDIV
jgi:hypothetical protein